VAIVTGGGNGIGRATAELLVEAGAAVALIDRDERAVENTKVALLAAGAQVEAYIVDVTDEAAIEASFASVDHQWGRLDILVNNAGISIRHPTMELSLADWNNVAFSAGAFSSSGRLYHALASEQTRQERHAVSGDGHAGVCGRAVSNC
jgi:NAD(P)-dependent dehydrogenase (short-subunit alcohol dehydrogenase family)